MKRLLLVLALVLLPYTVQAQGDSDWTEVSVTAFDQIDGDFAPRLSAAVVNYMGGKGIGAFLGMDNAIGPLTKWRVWERSWGPKTRWSIFLVSQTNVNDAADLGIFSNGTFGLEPRFYWSEFGNADIGLGILSATFVEGEEPSWTPYVTINFRP